MSLRILVVEDEAEIADFLVRGLREEGFAVEAETYQHVGDAVLSEVSQWGRDCDGATSWEGEFACPLDQLQAEPEEQGEYGWRPARPAWKKLASRAYDQYAEAAGY